MIFWMAVTFGIGAVLMAIDYYLARKKKGGFTYTDRQRIIGIFWLSVFAAALVGSLIWFSPD
jgi:ABC-type branched-subunit amino acid transport system permease subunit